MSVHVRTPVRTDVFVVMDMKRKLIGLIKNQRVLYNTCLSEYKDNASRVEAWKHVAEEMGMTVDECKSEWVKLRNSYVNALRRRVNHQNRTGKILHPWVFETEMSFIKPFMTGRGWDDTPYTVLLREHTEDTEDTDSERLNLTPKLEPDSIIDDDPIYMNRDESSSKHEYINESSSNTISKIVNEIDESDLFFLGLSQTMKKLPKIEQCRLKMDMFKMMNDAEMKHLECLRKRRRKSSGD